MGYIKNKQFTIKNAHKNINKKCTSVTKTCKKIIKNIKNKSFYVDKRKMLCYNISVLCEFVRIK